MSPPGLPDAPADPGDDPNAHANGLRALHAENFALRQALKEAETRAAVAQAEATRLNELLHVARSMGRIGVWERDPVTGRGLWDRQVFRMRGMEGDGEALPIDEAMSHVIEADRAGLVRVYQASLKTPGLYAHRFRVLGVDGQLRQLQSNWLVKPALAGQHQQVLGLIMDDTQAWNLARSYDETAQQLAMVVDVAGIVVWRHDLASDRLHYNAQGYRLLGLEPQPEGLTLEQARRLVHPDDLQQLQADTALAQQGLGPAISEARYRNPDGQYRTLLMRRGLLRDQAGRPATLLGVALDVTDQRRAEAALHEASERASLATRGAGIGTWEADLVNHTAIWDEQMWRLRGQTPRDQVPGVEDRLQFVHPEDRAMMREISDTTDAASHQFRVRWPDGSVRWLASRSTGVRDSSGQVVRRIGVNWDVTDSRMADAAHQAREIAQRESLAKSQFLARMSHELRTPLNAVLGFAQLLHSEETGQDAAAQVRQRRVQHIQSAGQHLLDLINDVLDLSSLESGEVRIALQPVALAPLLAQTLPLVEPLMQAHGVQLQAGPVQATVLADATRLRQVLVNLLSNAAKYNRPGGRVAVRCQTEPAQGGAGPQVCIEVQDSGLGMDEAQLAHLFEPFNRLGAEREGVEGTGIGLAIVKALVERMGGSVQVHSRLGEGSVFQVRLADGAGALASAQAAGVVACETTGEAACGTAHTADAGGPIHSRPATAPGLGARPARVPAPGANGQAAAPPRGRLLYIEDNPVNALIIAELIGRRPDLQLHLAADGVGGVREAQWLQPDLVLLDMQLPDIDGHEVLRRLRAEPSTAHIPVIALSANAMPDDIDRALQAGISDYWTKPLDFRAFMASIEALFGPAPS